MLALEKQIHEHPVLLDAEKITGILSFWMQKKITGIMSFWMQKKITSILSFWKGKALIARTAKRQGMRL